MLGKIKKTENIEKNIVDLSPHFFGEASRYFSENELNSLAQALVFSKERGGFLELDFIRKIDASYNPRPARVALILIKEVKLVDFHSTISSMLFTINEKHLSDVSLIFPPEITFEVTKITSFVRKGYESAQFDSYKLKEASSIALSHFLDHARHFHLNPLATIQDWQKIINQAHGYLKLAEETNNALYQKLAHWINREQKRIN